MKSVFIFATILLISTIFPSCNTNKRAVNAPNKAPMSIPGPQVIIYQTTKDFSQLVPIIMSDDKKEIVSYPDIKDIYFKGTLAYPTMLHNGFLLDNRGIDKNVVFIKLSYEEYSKLARTPSAEELMSMITDSQPIRIMYSCGNRAAFKSIEEELNSKIDSGDFSGFTRIK